MAEAEAEAGIEHEEAGDAEAAEGDRRLPRATPAEGEKAESEDA